MKEIEMKFVESEKFKACRSDDYNFLFNKETGEFARWGTTKEDDPAMSPFGPEILDMEIESGECMGNCGFCYKKNGSGVPTKVMSLDRFKEILAIMPKTLTQIAFGITNIGDNPDFFNIMEHSRSMGVIPNYTCHGLDVTTEYAEMTAELCGAVAVSIVKKQKSYNAIRMFLDAGMDQVNIHYMLAEETYDRAFHILEDMKTDERLKGMRAIVFLQYKPKGRGVGDYTPISSSAKYKKLIEKCDEMGIPYGFDSCSAPLFFKGIEDHPNKDQLAQMGEPCESGLFSFYCNVDGDFFPCSFSEGTDGWTTGINWDVDNFLKDIWHNARMELWRKNLVVSSDCCDCSFKDMCRSCPIYPEITACKKELAGEN